MAESSRTAVNYGLVFPDVVRQSDYDDTVDATGHILRVLWSKCERIVMAVFTANKSSTARFDRQIGFPNYPAAFTHAIPLIFMLYNGQDKLFDGQQSWTMFDVEAG